MTELIVQYFHGQYSPSATWQDIVNTVKVNGTQINIGGFGQAMANVVKVGTNNYFMDIDRIAKINESLNERHDGLPDHQFHNHVFDVEAQLARHIVRHWITISINTVVEGKLQKTNLLPLRTITLLRNQSVNFTITQEEIDRIEGIEIVTEIGIQELYDNVRNNLRTSETLTFEEKRLRLQAIDQIFEEFGRRDLTESQARKLIIALDEGIVFTQEDIENLVDLPQEFLEESDLEIDPVINEINNEEVVLNEKINLEDKESFDLVSDRPLGLPDEIQTTDIIQDLAKDEPEVKETSGVVTDEESQEITDIAPPMLLIPVIIISAILGGIYYLTRSKEQKEKIKQVPKKVVNKVVEVPKKVIKEVVKVLPKKEKTVKEIPKKIVKTSKHIPEKEEKTVKEIPKKD